MGGSFTETRKVSWFSRLKNSVIGVLIGLLLVAGMIWLLFWNEGRTIREARSLTEGADVVVSVGAGSIDAANEGRLIHVTGPVTTSSHPADMAFGVIADGVRLVRRVEMYQWREEARSETVTKVGGGEETATTYDYVKAWVDEPQDSSRFRVPGGHENPPMEIRSQRFQLRDARLGAFELDAPILDRIGGERPLALTREQIVAIGETAGGRLVSLVDKGAYLGIDPTSPQIGDYRISYTVAPLGMISVIAGQAGAKFVPYKTSVGNEILLVEEGVIAADAMFASAQAENRLLKWILRAAGLLFLFVGFTLVLAPIAVVADVLPPVGGLVRMGTGLIAFLLTIVVGALTVAVAWFWHRPLMAIAVIAIGAVMALGVAWLGRLRAARGMSAAKTT